MNEKHIYYNKKIDKFQVYLHIPGQGTKYIGQRETIEAARVLRDEALALRAEVDKKWRERRQKQRLNRILKSEERKWNP